MAAAGVAVDPARVAEIHKAAVARLKAEQRMIDAKNQMRAAYKKGKHACAALWNTEHSRAIQRNIDARGLFEDRILREDADCVFLLRWSGADIPLWTEAYGLVRHVHPLMAPEMAPLMIPMLAQSQERPVDSKVACNLRVLVAMAALILRAKNDPLGRLSVADAEKRARAVVSRIYGCEYICPCPHSDDCMCTCDCVRACTPGDECAFA